MIGLILGTAEGKRILSLLNEFTEDIFVSTATSYGGELLQNYKYAFLNTKPLDQEALENALKENKVNILIDASHPYAQEVTRNSMEACRKLRIEYVRYERPSVVEKYRGQKNVILLPDYDALPSYLDNVKGAILNTTGSRNIEKLMKLDIKNRMIHRVLPSVEVMKQCLEFGVKVENLIAMKGPISFELNCSFMREYNAQAILLKDSGKEGGTEEKIRAALDVGGIAFVIERKKVEYDTLFQNEEELAEYIRGKHCAETHYCSC